MSAPTKADNKAKDGTKRLSLAKRTLKNLSVRSTGPKGGFISGVPESYGRAAR
jgi:hypothetical protein